MTDYLSLSVLEINDLLKQKKITPLNLVEEAFEKIESNPELNCFITLDKEMAIKRAKELENIAIDNPLFGIPIAIKDNICTNNLRTTCASKILENFIPIYDATVIEKIKSKNMIIIGKTNMDEFAMGSSGVTSYFKPALNPWDHQLTPGGSSSGSAVSVSARIVSLALGTDTGGSIRQPSSFTGIVGLKPTYGLVSRYGLVAFASSLDQIGPMAKNVYDNALLLNIIAGQDSHDLTSKKKEEEDYTRLIGKDVKGMKIAIPNFYMSKEIDEEIRNKVKMVSEMLESNGAIINYIDIDMIEYAVYLYQIIALAEASSNLARYDGIRYGYQASDYNNIDELYKKTRSEGFGEEVKRRLMIGTYVLSGKNAQEYYYKALKIRHQLKANIEEKFKDYDLIMGPTTTSTAYKLSEGNSSAIKSFIDDILTIPVNMAGLPGLSLPIGFSNNNLPIGLQIIGPAFSEAKIYQLADFIEKKVSLSLNPNQRGNE